MPYPKPTNPVKPGHIIVHNYWDNKQQFMLNARDVEPIGLLATGLEIRSKNHNWPECFILETQQQLGFLIAQSLDEWEKHHTIEFTLEQFSQAIQLANVLQESSSMATLNVILFFSITFNKIYKNLEKNLILKTNKLTLRQFEKVAKITAHISPLATEFAKDIEHLLEREDAVEVLENSLEEILSIPQKKD